MALSFWLLVCLCAVVAEDRVSYDGSQLLQVNGVTNKLKDKLVELEDKGVLELWNKNATNVDVFVRKDKLNEARDELQKANFQYRVLVDNLQEGIDTENPPLAEEEEALSGRQGHRMTFDHYHRMADIHGYLNYLSQTYPQFVSLQEIGTSVEGRPLKIIKISSGVENPKAMWIDGGIHAREWISPASVSYIISELVENRDAHIASIKGIDYYILPILNPDGYEYSHTVDRLWRKNRGKSSNCVGTDLNRNWGYHWGGPGSSNHPCKEIYAGERAFSEPETAAVSQFVMNNAANMKAYVTFHSYGQYILYPWGYDRKVPPDYADLDRVGRKAAAAMRSAGGPYYRVGSSAATLYAASGGADDWAKGVAKIKYTYTIELRDTGRFGFVLPASYIKPTAKEALAAIKAISQEVQQTS